jgi:hypothetical protein
MVDQADAVGGIVTREWLQNSHDTARRSKQVDGLGLTDIRPQRETLVLVGRRSHLFPNSAGIRNRIREENGTRVHICDWLVETPSGA